MRADSNRVAAAEGRVAIVSSAASSSSSSSLPAESQPGATAFSAAAPALRDCSSALWRADAPTAETTCNDQRTAVLRALK